MNNRRFTVLKNFHAPEVKTWYVYGQTYRVTPTLEQTLIPKWLREGKIRLVDVPQQARIRGNDQ